MPDEAGEHERTWMTWPSSTAIWGRNLAGAQESVASIALAILEWEKVTVLARPSEVAALQRRLGSEAEVLEAPVDDLWARDTLPTFLTTATGQDRLAAGLIQFNGWGDKQEHAGDALLSRQVAAILGVPLVDVGLTGEGGGVEGDGAGTIIANRSSWVNENRNPGWSEERIEMRLLELTGASRMLWADGVRGQDITDDHIDASARFTSPGSVIIQVPLETDGAWAEAASQLVDLFATTPTLDGAEYVVDVINDPESVRSSSSDLLTSYANYYLCNGAVIAPQFGDKTADDRARGVLADHYPNRTVVQLDIDGVAAGGGGVHCATRQQPRV